MTKPTPARRFTAALAAAAVALAGLTATAAPARAQNTDAAKILLGITALAIIGAAIANANQPAPAHPPYGWRPPPHPPLPPAVHPRPPVVHPPAYLPARCEFDAGGRVYFGEACLIRSGFTQRLPQSCARQVQTPRGWRVAYDGACLRQAGWR